MTNKSDKDNWGVFVFYFAFGIMTSLLLLVLFLIFN